MNYYQLKNGKYFVRAAGLIATVMLAGGLGSCSSERSTSTASSKTVEVAADGWLVKISDEMAGASPSQKAARDQLFTSNGLKETGVIGALAKNWFRVGAIKSDTDVQNSVTKLLGVKGVLAAEPNYVVQGHAVVPNDPSYRLQYALQNDPNGTTINVGNIWSLAGSAKTIVAVLDTGVDREHPDLVDNIWVNNDEIPGNNIDDDANGKVDDVSGWNFAGNNDNTLDDNGHGTHVAGIIGANSNNGLGVTGVNWSVRIMPLKVLDKNGLGSVANIVSALQYAIEKGSKISNLSFGSEFKSSAFFEALENANRFGHIVIASAGNEGVSTDTKPIYPANFDLANVISVAAVNQTGDVASFSNFGNIDIAAPGLGIYSTYPRDRSLDGSEKGYVLMSGSSAAAAYTSGLVSIMIGQSPELNADQIRTLLNDSATKSAKLAGKVKAGGILNADRAVSLLTSTPATDTTNTTTTTQPVLATTPSTPPATSTTPTSPTTPSTTTTSPATGTTTSPTQSVTLAPLALVSPSTTNLLLGATMTLSATGGDGNYTWFTSDSAIVNVDSLSGLVTAKSKGVATITVRDGISNVDSIALTINLVPVSFVLPSVDTLWVGNFQNALQLSVGGGQPPYTWTTDNPTMLNVDSTGYVAARDFTASTVAATTQKINVIVNDSANNTATLPLTVRKLAILVDRVTASVNDVINVQIAGVTPIRYAINGTGTATFNEATMKMTATGTGTVRLTITDANGNTAVSDAISIQNLPLSINVVSNPEIWVGNANTAQLSASYGQGTYTWSTDTPALVTVNSTTGLVTAKAPGSATVRVTDQLGNSNTTIVTVRQVTVSAPATTINAYDSLLFSGVGYGALSWSVSDTSKATISTAGLLTAKNVAANTSVNVTVTDQNGNSATKSLNINAAQSLVVNASLVNTIWLGQFANTVSLSASGGYGQSGYTWSTDTPSLVTVDSVSGLVTAKAVGTASVRVTDTMGNTNTTSIFVNRVSLSSSVTTIKAYDSLQFSGVGYGTLSWSVSDTSKATISTSGLLTAKNVSTNTSVTVKVTDQNGNTASTTVSINALQALSISSPSRTTLWTGNNANSTQLSATGGSGGYTWSVSSSSSSGVVSVSSSGLVTGKADGTATVQVRDSVGNVTNVDFVVKSVYINAASTLSVTVGTTIYFAGVGEGQLTWSASNSGGSINSSTGVFTAQTGGTTVVVSMKDSNNNNAINTISVSISGTTGGGGGGMH